MFGNCFFEKGLLVHRPGSVIAQFSFPLVGGFFTSAGDAVQKRQ